MAWIMLVQLSTGAALGEVSLVAGTFLPGMMA